MNRIAVLVAILVLLFVNLPSAAQAQDFIYLPAIWGPPPPFDPSAEVFIPAGTFQMGCDSSSSPFPCDADELPLHPVYLDDYYVDKYEVTNARYKACVDAGVCSTPRDDGSKTRDWYYDNPDYEDYPVIYVDWFQAEEFCGWEGKRLPTEAEWEKAARGSDDTRIYPWGNTPPTCDVVNGYVDGWCKGDTMEVGSYAASATPYGAMDMSGNVWEWINDWYKADYYAESPASNPRGPAAGEKRVLRGGSWFDTGNGALRFVNRPALEPYGWGEGYGTLGFRCVRSP